MPGVDWIPGVSQLKATLQFVTGDFEGAAQTQENFVKECPVVSQVTSVVQLVGGDADGAYETQMRCLKTVDNFANGIPVVGHVKGHIHHIVGDPEGGNQAFDAANRSTIIISTGAVVGLTTGGLAAIPAGIAAGVGYDAAMTLATDKPQGYIAAIGNAIENPSAGSIFDAAAIPVGDGLAGYSGGQMATQIKLNMLEYSRGAKLEQLNAAMFNEPGGEMKSGPYNALAENINSLTAEINTIRHGTPQYWYDPKTGQTTIDVPKSSTAIPIVGYCDNDDETSSAAAAAPAISTSLINPEIFARQENGILSDSYVDTIVTDNNRKVKRVLLEKNFKQTPGKTTLGEAYPKVEVTTRKDLENLKKSFQPNKPPNRKWKRVPSNYSWLLVEMPRQFNYTGVIMLNNPFQGLLHSFIRHSDDWQHYISGVNDLLDIMSDLKDQLKKVRDAYNADSSTEAILEFIEARRQLSHDTYIAAQEAAMDAQMNLHRFIQDNITYKNYLGEGANVNGKEQVFFEVRNNRRERQVMVVCVSDQLFPAAFSSGRPIRTITSIFFIDWKHWLNSHIMKKF